MKKSPRKLHLSRETLRELETPNLGPVAGGWEGGSLVPLSCNGYCDVTMGCSNSPTVCN
jgi:hypothetical protein